MFINKLCIFDLNNRTSLSRQGKRGQVIKENMTIK